MNTPGIPPLIWSILRAIAQKGVTALAVALTGYGVLAPDQQTQFIGYAVAATVWLISFGWTVAHEWYERQAKKELLASPPQR